MNVRHMAFLSSGDQEAAMSLQVATQATVNNFGRVDARCIIGDQDMDQNYRQQGSFTLLILSVQPTAPNVTAAT